MKSLNSTSRILDNIYNDNESIKEDSAKLSG